MTHMMVQLEPGDPCKEFLQLTKQIQALLSETIEIEQTSTEPGKLSPKSIKLIKKFLILETRQRQLFETICKRQSKR